MTSHLLQPKDLEAWTQMICTFGKTTTGQGWRIYNNGNNMNTYQYSSAGYYSYLYDYSYHNDDVILRLNFAGNTSLNFNQSKA